MVQEEFPNEMGTTCTRNPSDDAQFGWCHSFLELEYPKVFVGILEKDDWTLFFDISKCIHGYGVRIVLINPYSDLFLCLID